MARSIAGRLPTTIVTRPLGYLGRRIKVGSLGPLSDVPFNVKTLVEAGVIRPVRPDRLALMLRVLARWGASPAAGIAAAAINRPDAAMIMDEAGELTFEELHRRSNSLARGLAGEGIREGDGVAIMCRNHHGFIEATLAVSKLGANGLFMNTAFAGPQLAGVVERELPVALIYDQEFAGLLEQAAEAGEEIGLRRFVAWTGGEATTNTALDDVIEANDAGDLDPPTEPSRFVILTSGTTGAPKGAQRAQPDTLSPLAAMFSKMPLRSEERTMIAAPLFHSWGFAHFTLGLALGSTYVLRRRFDPEETLRATEESGATALVVVPVMMQRILELPPETLTRYELPNLRVTAASGSALPGELAIRWMDTFGDNLYNLYGSTEVAWATIATPEDLRAAPGTAGRPPRGTAVRVVDREGNDVEAGRTGRVFVGNEMAFEGYTGGGAKDMLDGLLSSGDVGHFDQEGRLFIDGRDDEMIVSGGENVFPREVEDLLSDHDKIKEVAVIGVDDEQFGQRLKAFVVPDDGADVSEDDVKGYVKSNLARYKVPREVEFLDSLPRNATGKVLKRELA
ncbi:MAG TPA: AMP-binding protein [Solirubrobacterales bacterium]|nr:AMP-binding protein [Solirubrobacterales bacterium]